MQGSTTDDGINGMYTTVQDRINSAIYHDAGITHSYPTTGLDIAESVALLKHRDAVVGKDILDIGIGTGRTSKVLMRVAKRYVGIDYSEPMVRFVLQALPGIEAHRVDMRNLDRWHEQSFDFVIASNNVIDAVCHEDRLQTLREVHRVLRPGGVFMFSSHNRAAPAEVAKTRPKLTYSKNPLSQLKHIGDYLLQKRNFNRLSLLHEYNPQYSVITDISHNFSLLHYYIDQPCQRSQLQALGFSVLDVVGRYGAILGSADLARESASLLYVAQRVP